MPLTLRKRGKYWHARGTVPAKRPDGSIGRIRIEESTRTESKSRARDTAADLERHYHDLAYGRSVQQGPSFAEAAITYIQTRGKSDRFVTKLIGYFRETPIGEINQASVAAAAHALYPGASASTHIRAVFAPVTTILRLSGVGTRFARPKADKAAIAVPPDDWFDHVLPHCPPKLAALLATLTLTGRRVTELTGIKPGDVQDGVAVIGRTKTGKPVTVRIPEMALDLLAGAPQGAHRRSPYLFGYANKDNVRRALKRACEAAGVPLYGTHALGRHAFATRLLKEGKSLKFVADAGGWASIKMPAQHYAHLEKQDVEREVERLGQEWGRKRKIGPN